MRRGRMVNVAGLGGSTPEGTAAAAEDRVAQVDQKDPRRDHGDAENRGLDPAVHVLYSSAIRRPVLRSLHRF